MFFRKRGTEICLFYKEKDQWDCLKIELFQKITLKANQELAAFFKQCVSIMGLFPSILMSRARGNCVILFLKSQMKSSMNANECRLCVYLFRLQQALLKEMQHTCYEMYPLFCANINEFPNVSCSLD